MRGFECKEHETEFWSALKEGSLPLKFAFSGDGAYAHNRLANQSSYRQIAGFAKIEVDPLVDYFAKHEPISQLCDIGPGNGIHSGAFLDAMLKNNYPIERYLALDFSKTLLEIDTGYLKKKFPYIGIDSSTWDFERGPTKAISDWRNNNKVLTTLTGHTLGNPKNPFEVLRNIFLSSLPGDNFQLGVALIYDEKPDHFLENYQNDIFKAAVLEPLKMAGIDIECGEFRLSFSKEEKSIIGVFVFCESTAVEYNSEAISFKKGDRIHCFTSIRFEDSDVSYLLKKSGWNILEIAYSDQKTHAIYLCERGSA
jgi:L-histidine Nalpha-methyltransferase